METKQAIIYARVSSVGDRQNTERQISDLTRYAEYSNLTVVKIFEEHISGAKRNTERPVLLEAIEYAKSNNISQILISELSRLGRNAFEVLSTVKEMIDAGINIYFQKEQFTLLDDEGKPSLFAPVMIATLSTCAQLERENIKFRLNSGRANYIAKGGRLGRKKRLHQIGGSLTRTIQGCHNATEERLLRQEHSQTPGRRHLNRTTNQKSIHKQ